MSHFEGITLQSPDIQESTHVAGRATLEGVPRDPRIPNYLLLGEARDPPSASVSPSG